MMDHFEKDGRRWVVAVDNRPKCPGIDLLSKREREVLRLAQLGQHNKAIAYNLGLAESTVRVLLMRASAKVGTKSRPALLEKTRELTRETLDPGRRRGRL